MPETTSPQPIKPLLTREQMEKIVSSRRSLTSEEFYQQVETHLGRPLEAGRKQVWKNGRVTWVCS